MYIAEKANRVVRIPDEKKEEYVGMGYTVKNMDGTIVKEPVNPKKEVEVLKKELKAAHEKIAALEAENAELKAANGKQAAPTPEEKPAEKPAETAEKAAGKGSKK